MRVRCRPTPSSQPQSECWIAGFTDDVRPCFFWGQSLSTLLTDIGRRGPISQAPRPPWRPPLRFPFFAASSVAGGQATTHHELTVSNPSTCSLSFSCFSLSWGLIYSLLLNFRQTSCLPSVAGECSSTIWIHTTPKKCSFRWISYAVRGLPPIASVFFKPTVYVKSSSQSCQEPTARPSRMLSQGCDGWQVHPWLEPFFLLGGVCTSVRERYRGLVTY